jgi:hypothetical protein
MFLSATLPTGSNRAATLPRAWSTAPRRCNSAALGHLLEPDGDVDALAVDVAAVDDDVAEIDAMRGRAARRRHVVGIVGQDPLRLDGAFHRVDDAVEGDQRPIAGGLDDAAAVPGDERL